MMPALYFFNLLRRTCNLWDNLIGLLCFLSLSAVCRFPSFLPEKDQNVHFRTQMGNLVEIRNWAARGHKLPFSAMSVSENLVPALSAFDAITLSFFLLMAFDAANTPWFRSTFAFPFFVFFTLLTVFRFWALIDCLDFANLWLPCAILGSLRKLFMIRSVDWMGKHATPPS